MRGLIIRTDGTVDRFEDPLEEFPQHNDDSTWGAMASRMARDEREEARRASGVGLSTPQARMTYVLRNVDLHQSSASSSGLAELFYGPIGYLPQIDIIKKDVLSLLDINVPEVGYGYVPTNHQGIFIEAWRSGSRQDLYISSQIIEALQNKGVKLSETLITRLQAPSGEAAKRPGIHASPYPLAAAPK